jgi:hypothetical protein
MSTVKNFKDLSTSYVNLAALIRHLREQQFAGTIHVIIDQYEAEVRLNAGGEPTVAEIDRANGRASENEGAMERLLVHAREPDGKITVRKAKPATSRLTVESSSRMSLGQLRPLHLSFPLRLQRRRKVQPKLTGRICSTPAAW